MLERPREGGPPWVYEGHIFAPQGRRSLRAEVAENGTVSVAGLGPVEPREGATAPELEDAVVLAEKAKLLLRTAVRSALAREEGAAEGDGAGAAPPRRIVRWRGEK